MVAEIKNIFLCFDCGCNSGSGFLFIFPQKHWKDLILVQNWCFWVLRSVSYVHAPFMIHKHSPLPPAFRSIAYNFRPYFVRHVFCQLLQSIQHLTKYRCMVVVIQYSANIVKQTTVHNMSLGRALEKAMFSVIALIPAGSNIRSSCRDNHRMPYVWASEFNHQLTSSTPFNGICRSIHIMQSIIRGWCWPLKDFISWMTWLKPAQSHWAVARLTTYMCKAGHPWGAISLFGN